MFKSQWTRRGKLFKCIKSKKLIGLSGAHRSPKISWNCCWKPNQILCICIHNRRRWDVHTLSQLLTNLLKLKLNGSNLKQTNKQNQTVTDFLKQMIIQSGIVTELQHQGARLITVTSLTTCILQKRNKI